MTGPEIVEFSKAINLAYTYDELKQLLLKLDRRIQDYVPREAVFPTQVDELVGAANSQGWISQLVLAALNDRPNNEYIKDFLSRRPYWDPARHPPLAHPTETLRILGGDSFIGRDVLRSALRNMDQPTNKKILLVTSVHRKVGKTYSKELVNFISQSTSLTEMAYVDLDKETCDQFKLAKMLAREMKLDPNVIPAETTEQAARANQELVSLLITRSTDPAPKVWWIVLDGFRDHVPSEAIQDFIAQLAQRIKRTTEYRLILVNYDYSLPLAVDGFSFKDNLQPLTRAELETHFINVHRRHKKTNPSPQQLADYLKGMDDLLQTLHEKHRRALDDQELINIAVSEVANTIEEVS
jgi:Effector-associated domain 1